MAVAAAHAPPREVLALADGVELVGEYEDSGFKEPPLLARRADGQMIQLSRVLYLTAAAADGRRDPETVAAIVSEHYGRRVSADNVRFLADERLRPLGVLALRDGSTPELPKRQALFALRCRKRVLGERPVNAIGRSLAWLHRPALTVLLLLALAAFDLWLFGLHGIAPALRVVIYDPTLLLAVITSTVVAAAWHECGHASACRYGGARPGVVGVGLYLVWPAFYCDVTDAYRLDRVGRLRTDLGGVYFNALFALGAGAAYFATGQEALLLVAFIQHTVILHQLLPLLRFDGYYVLSDLTGVPDILSRIKPIFRSLVRGRRNEPRVDELKPWVRIVVTAYLLVLVPALAFLFACVVLSAPRVFATAYDSLGLQLDRAGAADGFVALALAVVRIGALLLPTAAVSLSLARSGRMALRKLAAWSRGSAPRRTLAIAGLAVLAGALVDTWSPDGDYEPIRPGERGTIGEVVRSIPEFAPARPPFVTEPARSSDSAPIRHQDAAETRSNLPGARPGERTEQRPAPERTPERSGDQPADEDTEAPTPEAGTPTATPGSTETPTPTAAAPLETSTATPEPTPTPTPTATATPEATASPTAPEASSPAPPAESPSPSATASAEPSPTPTP